MHWKQQWLIATTKQLKPLHVSLQHSFQSFNDKREAEKQYIKSEKMSKLIRMISSSIFQDNLLRESTDREE